jgi:transposase-like protein
MTTSKKTYSNEEKAEILAYVDANSVKEATAKFGVSANSITKWKKGGSSKTKELDRLRKFRDKVMLNELQKPETKERLWSLLLQDQTVRTKITDMILDEAA